jgi:hypothetical protein
MGHDFRNGKKRDVRHCTDGGSSCTNIGSVMDYFQVCSFYFSLLLRANEIHTIELLFSILFRFLNKISITATLFPATY